MNLLTEHSIHADPADEEARDRRAGTAATMILAALLLLVVVGLKPFAGPLTTDPILTGDGDILRQASFLLIFIVAVAMLGPRNLAAAIPVSILIVLVWCVLSLAWAIEPAVGLRRLGLTSLVIATTFLCVSRAGEERTIYAAQIVLLLVLALNLLAVALWRYGIHLPDELEAPLAGSWRGVLKHKNFAGSVCALTVLFLIFPHSKVPAVIRYCGIVGALAFLAMTNSKTSMALLIVALAVGYAYMAIPRNARTLMLAIIMLTLAAICIGAALHSENITRLLDQPDTLTGRVQIWSILLDFAFSNLWLGSGYGSFWNIGASSPVNLYTANWVSEISSGHSGYLDVLVQIGAPGLALVLIAVLIIPLVAVLVSDQITSDVGALIIAVMFFCAGHNVTESSFMDRDAVVWVFLLIAIALLRVVQKRAVRLSSGSSV